MDPDEKILRVTVGLPRGGKSTWAREVNCPMVCPDAIRLAIHGQRYIEVAEPFVWLIAHTMVRALFLAGHKYVVLDSTNTTRRRRDEWRSSEWRTFFKIITTPAEICFARARDEGDEHIMEIIDRMAENYEPLQPDEKVWL